MQPVEILTRAKALISDPAKWTQGHLARHANGNPIGPNETNATCFCALGAVDHVTPRGTSTYDADRLLNNAAMKLCGRSFGAVWVNDGKVQIDGLTPHQAVLKMFDLAIEEARDAS